jgi:NMD protein affecting ribosome stability and mRNA decay
MKQVNPGQYFEAVFQLRNPNKEAVSCIVNAVNKRKDVFIAKQIEVKGGIDFYISSQRFTRSLGKKLKKSFKGELKESKKLFGMNHQTSRQVYRGTMLFRIDEPVEKEEKKIN